MIINKIQEYRAKKHSTHEIIVWLTDQNSQPLETEDRINLTMVIK